MFPVNQKPQLSPKELIEKIKKLKPEFDKLTDYKSKLVFWSKNGFDISIRTYGISDEPNVRDLPENNITIYPENNEEIKAYKKHYYRIFHRENFNTLQTSIATYWKQIEAGANPIPHTKNVIAEIDKEYKDNNKFADTGHNSFRSYCNGFDASENGQIEIFLDSNSFHNNLHVFFTGEVHEKYKRFLEKQLNKLENSKSETYDLKEKLNISCKLIGKNKPDSVSPVFHHIKEVLKSFRLTSLEAREILLDMQGANSPQMNANVVEPIIKYLERIEEQELKTVQPQQKGNTNPLENYRNFCWQFQAFLKNCKWNYGVSKSDKVREYCQKMRDIEIYNIGHRAKQEIENLVFAPNAVTAHVLIESINNDCLKLEKEIRTIIDDNNLSHVDNMPKNRYFFDIIYEFRGFHYWFAEKFKALLPIEVKDEKEKNKQSVIELPENLYPLIFKNGYAYQMFLELKELTVKNKTIVADYSFIFHKMKDKHLKAINAIVTGPAFIEFLNKNFKTEIDVKKLPFKNPNSKLQVYSTILNKYQSNILM
ncbi:MAG TPA: hypothetical protein VNZ49_17335 [Bacteroidia bacterium]|jgi:hypothetical protein|nr:hypothetical protein [Bacteroidia bacterium]